MTQNVRIQLIKAILDLGVTTTVATKTLTSKKLRTKVGMRERRKIVGSGLLRRAHTSFTIDSIKT